jgi:acetyl-CoA carboxylase biotin carboxyl carrier protein
LLAEFELERDGLKLRVRKAGVPFPVMSPQMHAPVLPAMPQPVMAPPGQPVPAPAPPIPAGVDAELELAVVKSPIVGTFYRSPEPGAPAFVEVGPRVKKDVENGKPVQYGERLFAIKTT